jgi:hypothetical protein
MRKIINKQEVIDYLDRSINMYEQVSSKKFDDCNGFSQVPKNNSEAMYWYGKIDAYRMLLVNNR